MISIFKLDELAEIRGDETGRSHTYYYIDEKSKVLVASERWTELEEKFLAAGLPLELDHESLSFLLHHSFVPVGSSIVRGIGSLGVGDVIYTGVGREARREEDFPYFSERSSERSKASSRELLAKLTSAVARCFRSGASNWLMLSSGKDSVSLALAYANAGLKDVLCVTFDNGTDDEESVYAAEVCRFLGLKHERRSMPQDPSFVRAAIVAYFESMPIPCVDHVQLAYFLSLAQFGRHSGGLVIDGMGNDIYIGHVPTKRIARNERLAIPVLRTMRRLSSLGSRPDRLFWTRSELHFPAPLLRYADTRVFYDQCVDTHSILFNRERKLTGLSTFDFRAYMRGKHLDTGPGMQKVRNAAAFIGADSAFPWADPEVVDYCFNLPERWRYDRVNFRNKVLVREMLREFCGYDEARLPKRGFEFDGVSFVEKHWKFIEEEIMGCELWNRRVGSALRRLRATMKHVSKLNYPVLMMFMISGWYNHYYQRLMDRRKRAPT